VFLGKQVDDSSATDSTNYGFYPDSSVKPWDFNPALPDNSDSYDGDSDSP